MILELGDSRRCYLEYSVSDLLDEVDDYGPSDRFHLKRNEDPFTSVQEKHDWRSTFSEILVRNKDSMQSVIETFDWRDGCEDHENLISGCFDRYCHFFSDYTTITID